MDKSQLTKNVELLIKPILMSRNRYHINLVCCHIFYIVTHDILNRNTCSNFANGAPRSLNCYA